MNAFEEHNKKIAKENKKIAKGCFARPFSKDRALFDFSLRAMEDNEADAHNEPMYPIENMAKAMKILDDFRYVSSYLTKEQCKLVDTYTENLLRHCSEWMYAYAEYEGYAKPMENFREPVNDTTYRSDLGTRTQDTMGDLLETVHYILWWNGTCMYFDSVKELKKVCYS